VKSQSSEERHQHDRNSIQYRERSDRMPALNHLSRVLAIIEWRHPVASLAVLYWVATPIA